MYEEGYLIPENPELDDETLAHYGVKGMKWGVRRDPERRAQREAKKEEKRQRKASRYREKQTAKVLKAREGEVTKYDKLIKKRMHAFSKKKRQEAYQLEIRRRHVKDMMDREIKQIANMSISDIKSEKRAVAMNRVASVLKSTALLPVTAVTLNRFDTFSLPNTLDYRTQRRLRNANP